MLSVELSNFLTCAWTIALIIHRESVILVVVSGFMLRDTPCIAELT